MTCVQLQVRNTRRIFCSEGLQCRVPCAMDAMLDVRFTDDFARASAMIHVNMLRLAMQLRLVETCRQCSKRVVEQSKVCRIGYLVSCNVEGRLKSYVRPLPRPPRSPRPIPLLARPPVEAVRLTPRPDCPPTPT